jgi:hypothetical protein
MISKMLVLVAASGVLIGATAAAQPPQRGDGARPATAAHTAQKRVGERQHGASSRGAARRDRDDKTTGFGGRSGDDAFADDSAGGPRQGHLRGDRGADMMDNVKRDDQEPPE